MAGDRATAVGTSVVVVGLNTAAWATFGAHALRQELTKE
jgi:hypothetical protein